MSTIAAISTAQGAGGIGIIRISGEDSFKIIKKVFIPKNKKEKLNKIEGYNIKYGNIVDSKNNIIDEVLVSFFVAPKSYTKENMCEINSHGGVVVERKILEILLEKGAKLAEPGEFTKRAFLNGRIDLSQAEAVIDIINSKTEKESESSIKKLEGSLSKKLKEIREELLDIMADIEAEIDYPEYDIEKTTSKKIMKTLEKSKEKLERLEKSFERGKILKEGVKTSIVGKPNVGKSSLLNLLLNEERAIVSNIEGTTRDTIEEYINVNGISLKIIDTAGIRSANDEVEKIGVKKSKDIINDSDLVIFILDDSREFGKEDEEILELLKNKKVIVLLNKIDIGKGKIKENKKLKKYKIIEFSTKTEKGLDELYKEIEDLFSKENIDYESGEIITNIRQKNHITNALKQIEEALEETKKEMPTDILAIYIKNILEEIGYITGQDVTEDIINEIFSKFCLGK